MNPYRENPLLPFSLVGKLGKERMSRINRNGYVEDNNGNLEHRIIYKKTYGKIPKGWVVHHIDEHKTNNNIENLISLPERIHNLLHTYQRKYKRRLERTEIESFMKSPDRKDLIKKRRRLF